MAASIERDVPLDDKTTLGVGGPAEFFTVVTSEDELSEAIAFARTKDIPVTILGGGSNVLIGDKGIRGIVIKIAFTGFTITKTADEISVEVAAGEWFDDVVKKTVEESYWGLENLSGIPGTVGGGIVQNINAYGVTLGDMITSVRALHVISEEIVTLGQPECEFEYRNSIFKEVSGRGEYVVLSATIKLSRNKTLEQNYRSATQKFSDYFKNHKISEPQSADVREAVLQVRSNIGMLWGQYKSAGSFFKNPIISQEIFVQVEEKIKCLFPEKDRALSPWHWTIDSGEEKISAAFLMECTPFNKTDFKGQLHNNAVGISPLHSLSIINGNQATAADILSFVNKLVSTVEDNFGVTLESEVCFLDV